MTKIPFNHRQAGWHQQAVDIFKLGDTMSGVLREFGYNIEYEDRIVLYNDSQQWSLPCRKPRNVPHYVWNLFKSCSEFYDKFYNDANRAYFDVDTPGSCGVRLPNPCDNENCTHHDDLYIGGDNQDTNCRDLNQRKELTSCQYYTPVRYGPLV